MIKIREPFRTAGLKFSWPYKNREGVGIAKHHFEGEGDMYIEVSGKEYRISKEEARNFVNQTKSYYVAGKTPLGVLPIEILTELKNDNQDSLNL